MADSTNTTVLVIAAAAVVVAVVWSRRASAAPAGAGAAGDRRLDQTGSDTLSSEWADLLRAAGSLFSGISDLSREFSSDDSADYMIPGEPAFDPFQDCGGPGQISCEELEAQQNVYDLIGGR